MKGEEKAALPNNEMYSSYPPQVEAFLFLAFSWSQVCLWNSHSPSRIRLPGDTQTTIYIELLSGLAPNFF